MEGLKTKLKDSQHLIIEERDVERTFLSLKKNKSPGPDKISGTLLKCCASQLSFIFCYIFNMSLTLQRVPTLWKQALIVPIPKGRRPKVFNDFRPVALTSLIMKSFEKLVKSELLKVTEDLLDSMQFAYRAHRGAEDATITLLNLLFKHLEGSKTHARLLSTFLLLLIQFNPTF